MNQKIPVWKTIRFTLGNLTQNSWMYLRNSIFLQFFYIRIWIRIFNAYFSRNALYYWAIQLELRQFQDGTTQSGIHPAPDSLFIGVRVSYLHGVLDSHLHDLRNNSRHSFFMAQ